MDKPCDSCQNIDKVKINTERIDTLKETVEKIDKKVDESINKLEIRIEEVNKKTDNLDNSLSNRLTTIETKFDIYNDLTYKKLDGLEKKLDSLLVVKTDIDKPKAMQESQDMFREWLVKIGMKLLEFAVYGGVLYAFAKNLNLF